jgi:hypothetical protein
MVLASSFLFLLLSRLIWQYIKFRYLEENVLMASQEEEEREGLRALGMRMSRNAKA